MQDQAEFEAQEARLLAALRRIEAAGAASGSGADEADGLKADLSAARAEITTLKERLAQAQAEAQGASALEAEVAKLKGDLEGAEAGHAETLATLKAELEEARSAPVTPLAPATPGMSGDEAAGIIAELRAAAEGGVADADLINRAVVAELDALRQARAEDLVELQALVAELDPVLEEAANA